MKILSIQAKTLEKQKLNFYRSALFHMETRVNLKYFVNGCSFCKKRFCEDLAILKTPFRYAAVWYSNVTGFFVKL